MDSAVPMWAVGTELEIAAIYLRPDGDLPQDFRQPAGEWLHLSRANFGDGVENLPVGLRPFL
jgi:hypothetical protein